MPAPAEIKKQIDQLITSLIECSLIEDQNYTSIRQMPSNISIVDFGETDLSIALSNCEYTSIYKELFANKAYTFKLLDGALVQMMYEFAGDCLFRHRLAFFSSPYLEDFQNDPEIYELDEIYADVTQKNIVAFPLRFDYDSRAEVVKETVHPMSHLTLGQYENCRIPVTAPLTPYQFIHFILHCFYNTAYNKFSDRIHMDNNVFAETIFPAEREILHIHLPKRVT